HRDPARARGDPVRPAQLHRPVHQPIADGCALLRPRVRDDPPMAAWDVARVPEADARLIETARISSMPERIANLGSGFRALLAVIGAAALASGIIVAATELRLAYLGSPLVPTLLASLVAGLAALGGGLLIRGAVRGRIPVRDPRGRE